MQETARPFSASIRCYGTNQTDPNEGTEMGRQVAVVLYVVAMAAVIVGVDFVFFRNRFWERLTVNIGIVLVFAAFFLRFLRRPRKGAIAPFRCDCADALCTWKQLGNANAASLF